MVKNNKVGGKKGEQYYSNSELVEPRRRRRMIKNRNALGARQGRFHPPDHRVDLVEKEFEES